MPYAQLSDGTLVELIPYDPQMRGSFESAMHLPMKISPHCSIQGTSVAVIEAQVEGTHKNGLPEGLQPWQELPKFPK
ncbi:MAG: hypothetical protein KBD65_02785 [Candidatus Moranbacteria bacterium]|nr:hypothetical protein [Candidatus Moranbacteria bacterium]